MAAVLQAKPTSGVISGVNYLLNANKTCTAPLIELN